MENKLEVKRFAELQALLLWQQKMMLIVFCSHQAIRDYIKDVAMHLLWPTDVSLDEFVFPFYAFICCYAIDTDCILMGMPSAEGDRRSGVHALSAPLSHISWGLLLLPAALGENLQRSDDKQSVFHQGF